MDTDDHPLDRGARYLRAYRRAIEEQPKHPDNPQLLAGAAQALLELRTETYNRDGEPDLGGRSQAHRHDVAEMYSRAGVPREERATLQAAVRYHMQRILREYMRTHNYTDKDFEYYGLHPRTREERAADREREISEVMGRRRVPPDPFAGMDPMLRDAIRARLRDRVTEGAPAVVSTVLETEQALSATDPSSWDADEIARMRTALALLEHASAQLIARL